MTTFTSLRGVGIKSTPRDPRNRHLLPEAPRTSQRIMTGVAAEANNALDFNSNDLAYYKQLKNGSRCSCTLESIQDEVESQASSSKLNLSDFLLKVPSITQAIDFCPICYKTGFVGGYNRVGAFTACLDSVTNPIASGGINIVKERPYYFTPSNKNGTIEWDIAVPSTFSSVVDIAIRWKEEPARWNLYIDGQEPTEKNLIKAKGRKARIKLEMRDGSNPEAGLYCIFIVFGIASNIFVPSDFPQVNLAYTGELHIKDEIQSPVTVNVDNRAGDASTSDVFIDTWNNRIWRVITAASNTPMGELVGTALECRVVRPSEIYYYLPNKVIMRHYPNKAFTFLL